MSAKSLPLPDLTRDLLLPEGRRWAMSEHGRSYIAQWLPPLRHNIIVGNAISMAADAAAGEGGCQALERALELLSQAPADVSPADLLRALKAQYEAVSLPLLNVVVTDDD